MVETKVVFYANEKAMQKGIKSMQSKGWEVVSTEAVDRGYSGCKTCCLGLLFLPLALLGKKPKMWKVQYKREK
jgi:hypothetical protein